MKTGSADRIINIYIIQLCFLFFLLTGAFAACAEDADSTRSDQDRLFRIYMNYGNSSVYKGKKDVDVNHPYLTTSFFYKAKSNFTLTPAVQYLFMDNIIDHVYISPGWEFDFSNDDGYASLSYTYFYYNKNSPLPNSLLNHSFDGCLGYEFSLLYSELDAGYSFGTTKKGTSLRSSDFYLYWFNSKRFDWEEVFSEEDVFSIEPSLAMTLGTQNFYTNFKKLMNIKNPPARKANANAGPTATTGFSLLDFESELVAYYKRGHIRFLAGYGYIFPQGSDAYPTFRAGVRYTF